MEWIHAVDEMNMPIYESDLINVKEDGKESWTGIVWWGNEGCAICGDINKVGDDGFYGGCRFDKKNTKFTIIGNVFENPEIVRHLIEKKILKFPGL